LNLTPARPLGHAEPFAASVKPAPASRPASVPARGAWFQRDEAIMGTAIHVELWSDDAAVADSAMAAVMADMHRIDQAMSPYKVTSELSLVNQWAARQPVVVSRELFDLVERSIAFSRLSDGAFDITYASVGHLYDYREGRVPDAATVAAALPGVGWQHLRLDARALTIAFDHPATRIDLGGFAKGHAVDRGVAILRHHGIAHGIVSAGGDSHVLGDRRGRPWSVAVRDPRHADQVVAVMPLVDCAISTSGDYERYCLRDGVRHHHLIDPRTGRSADAVRSVTILADDGLSCEGLSKSVFVLGVERGLALVEAQDGVDAVVIDAEGRLHFSSGLLDGAQA
jgi:thiamine biosynthesis lipoprotein